jgi:hypothetical protein
MIMVACSLARPHIIGRLVVAMINYSGVKHTEWTIRVETLQTAIEGVVNAKGLRTLRVATYKNISDT